MCEDGERRSLYGTIDSFLRFVCDRSNIVENLALVSWFPRPTYPDNDPLWVRIDLGGQPPKQDRLLSLNLIDPTHVNMEVDRDNNCVNMLRVGGVDISPELE